MKSKRKAEVGFDGVVWCQTCERAYSKLDLKAAKAVIVGYYLRPDGSYSSITGCVFCQKDKELVESPPKE